MVPAMLARSGRMSRVWASYAKPAISAELLLQQPLYGFVVPRLAMPCSTPTRLVVATASTAVSALTEAGLAGSLAVGVGPGRVLSAGVFRSPTPGMKVF